MFLRRELFVGCAAVIGVTVTSSSDGVDGALLSRKMHIEGLKRLGEEAKKRKFDLKQWWFDRRILDFKGLGFSKREDIEKRMSLMRLFETVRFLNPVQTRILRFDLGASGFGSLESRLLREKEEGSKGKSIDGIYNEIYVASLASQKRAENNRKTLTPRKNRKMQKTWRERAQRSVSKMLETDEMVNRLSAALPMVQSLREDLTKYINAHSHDVGQDDRSQLSQREFEDLKSAMDIMSMTNVLACASDSVSGSKLASRLEDQLRSAVSLPFWYKSQVDSLVEEMKKHDGDGDYIDEKYRKRQELNGKEPETLATRLAAARRNLAEAEARKVEAKVVLRQLDPVISGLSRSVNEWEEDSANDFKEETSEAAIVERNGQKYKTRCDGEKCWLVKVDDVDVVEKSAVTSVEATTDESKAKRQRVGPKAASASAAVPAAPANVDENVNPHTRAVSTLNKSSKVTFNQEGAVFKGPVRIVKDGSITNIVRDGGITETVVEGPSTTVTVGAGELPNAHGNKRRHPDPHQKEEVIVLGKKTEQVIDGDIVGGYKF